MSEKSVSFPSRKRVTSTKSNPVWIDEAINVNLSLEQQYILKKFEQGENLFITGPGGTGKTMLIQHIIRKCVALKKQYQVTALTGCAALLLKCKAKTIHSWSGIKIAKGSKVQVISNVMKNRIALNEWRRTDVLIVDEVSMMSEKILNILEETGRIARSCPLPFGGIQVIFCGDFYQLPPVGNALEIETSNFCFESPIWNQIFKKENHIQLTHIFRQNDPTYINILQQIRVGELDENNKKILESYVGREKSEDVINPVKLFPIRSKVDYINNLMYSKLTTEEVKFPYIRKTNCQIYLESGVLIPEKIIHSCSLLSKQDTDYVLDQLVTNTQLVSELSLKIGALVMCTFNIDLENGICNGTTGVIQGFSNTVHREPIVKWANGLITPVELHWYQSEDYPTIAVGQYPLCLSWALTIHKIQGATLDTAEIDLGASIFEFAQTYVGLSRLKSLAGLYLTSFQANKIKVNPKVRAFYENLLKKTEEEMLSFLNEPKNIEKEMDFEEFSYNPSQNSDIKVLKML